MADIQVTPELRAEICELYEKGLSASEIHGYLNRKYGEIPFELIQKVLETC